MFFNFSFLAWEPQASVRGHVSGILDMGGQENNSTNPGDLYMVGQALPREKAFVQILGQVWFYQTYCQLKEKVSGRLFPNWYQENRLLMTHLFVYGNNILMIVWTVPQSHPFPHSASQLCSCQEQEHWTRACFTRGCWHVITKIFGFRTLLTSQICDPNKSPQCTNSTGKFESNFVPFFTIWVPTYW